jgi:hypothetical protein
VWLLFKDRLEISRTKPMRSVPLRNGIVEESAALTKQASLNRVPPLQSKLRGNNKMVIGIVIKYLKSSG